MNIGLIGCGRVAQLHLCAYKHIPEANVVAVSDINQDRAKAFAREYGIKEAFGDYAKILEMKDLDYVDICTPTATHADIACEAASLGNNVLLEKPMARSTKQCDRIVSEVSSHGVKLCVCHNQLFIPHIMTAGNIVNSGEFDLIYFRASVKENPEVVGPAAAWITTPAQGGILWESGLHLAYLQLHFLKEITEVLAVGSKIKYSVYDHFSVLLRTAKQAIGLMEVSWFAKRPEALYELMSSDGRRIHIADYDNLLELTEVPGNFLRGLYLDEKASLKKWVGPIINNLRNRDLMSCLPHYGLISRFMQSIRDDSDPPVTPEDARKTIQLLECIQESLERNQIVRI
jgi:UDP-N-acetylglucosamine 3-dehydrogenase